MPAWPPAWITMPLHLCHVGKGRRRLGRLRCVPFGLGRGGTREEKPQLGQLQPHAALPHATRDLMCLAGSALVRRCGG